MAFTASGAQDGLESGIPEQASLQLNLDLQNLKVHGSNLHSPESQREVQPKDLPDWSNLRVIHRNTLPLRSHFHIYNSEVDARHADVTRSRAMLLSGIWGFNLTRGPFNGPTEFYKPGFDNTAWPLIQVPGMWQLQGHGRGPQYTNLNYPFPVDPPRVPYDDNECGRYVTCFAVSPELSDGSQWRLRFEGVDAAFAVWLNGNYVGYSQGSRNPSEFDVSAVLNPDADDNYLAVEVYQRCDGSYIEDQDEWRMSGIFRDVWLHSWPLDHLEDFHVQTILDDDYIDASLNVEFILSKSNIPVTVKLLDEDGSTISDDKHHEDGQKLRCEYRVSNPKKWTAETPNLYTLVFSFGDSWVSQKIGFRRTELIDGVFCVNGNPVKFRGVNRHEHHPDSGRAVTYSFLKRDLLLMKHHGINSLRTSHQPNDTRLYDLANELGLWVLDEADLECHGFINIDGDPASFTSDNPAWEAAYVDRARQLVMRDKNHPCVIMWSLGNEAFYGRNHQAMYDEIKRIDQTRLVHYEQDFDAKTVDIHSRMYTPVDEMIKFGEEKDWKKPFVMCEYAHAMGNGPGAIMEYVEAFYKYPRLMGGFVWEWANHGLKAKSKEGEEYMAFGGDFGDEPNDYNFVMDGLCFSNHTPTPGLIEYSKAIEPVQVLGLDGVDVEIINRYDFLTLDHLRCRWDIISDRYQRLGKEVQIPKGLKPHSKGKIYLGSTPHTLSGEVWIQLEFYLRESTPWSRAGQVIATSQLPLSAPTPLSVLKSISTPGSAGLQIQKTGDLLYATLENGTTLGFSTINGTLLSLAHSGKPERNLITQPPELNFYRALTDNDRGGPFGQQWRDARLHQTMHHYERVIVEYPSASAPNHCTITVHGRIAPPVLAWSVDTTITYALTPTNCAVQVKASPRGSKLPDTFARFGLSLGLTSDVRIIEWFGRGPGESYVDKKQSQQINTWGYAVDGLATDYEFPQENGNRTDVRWVEFRSGWGGGTDGRLLRAQFGAHDGASFAAGRYSVSDLDECAHPYELKHRRRDDVLIRLDWFHHGLGTGSCGPATLQEYQLKTDRDFDVEVLLD